MSTFEWTRRPALRNPVALLAFTGWGDAGESATEAVRYLVDNHDAETIGRFDSDSFFDFQVNRPVVSLDEAGVRTITWPTTEILAIKLPRRDLVVVIGDEPNYNWKRFASDLSDVLIELGATTAVTMGAFVGQVAHTLPVPVVGSSSAPGMVAAHGLLPSRYEGPTGIVGVLTQTLVTKGLDACSLWAAVPHYLSNQPYPPGVEALLRKATDIAGISVDISDLEERATDFRESVDAAVDGSDELSDYVRQLEAESLDEDDGEEGIGEVGEDLVEEIERYLRDT